MPGAEFAELFNEALERYHDTTGKRLENLTAIRSTEQLITTIDAQNNDFKEYRKRASKLTTTLKYAVKPLETIGNMVAGAASAAFPPSSMICGACIYLIKAADGVSSKLDSIQELLETIQDFSVRLEVYFNAVLSTQLYGKLVQIMVTVIDIFARSTKTIKSGFGGRVGMFARNVLLGNNNDMAGLVKKLDKLTVSEANLVGAETLVESKETNAGVRDIQSSMKQQSSQLDQMNATQSQVARGTDHMANGIDRMADVMEKQEAKAKEEMLQRDLHILKEALTPSTTYLDRYLQIQKTRMPGSGEWIYHEDDLSTWIEPTSKQTLYCYGNPGAGKSFLAYNIVTKLSEFSRAQSLAEEVSVAYFFFRDNDITTQSVLQALKDIAYQLTSSDVAYAKYVLETVPSPRDISTIRVAWKKLFADYWLRSGHGRDRAYIVLDGLDEALNEDRETLFELLADLQDTDDCRLKVAMLGRPHVLDEITMALGKTLSICVDSSKNSADIVSYITTSVRKSRVLNQVSKQLKEKVITTLTNKAGGMFMWVNLMIAELSKKSKPSAIERALEDAPRGLKDMLTRVLEGFSERLDEDEASDLNDLLTWVCVAKRPLKLGELDAMLRLKSEDGEPDLLLESKLRQQFAAFFTLTRPDNYTTADLMNQVGNNEGLAEENENGEDSEDGAHDYEHQTEFDSNPIKTTVAFSHASISDFFTNTDQTMVSKPGRPEIGLRIAEAREKVILTCLNVLSDPSLQDRMKDTYGLEDYAETYWLDHLRDLDLESAEPAIIDEVGGKLYRGINETALLEKMVYAWNWRTYTQANAELLSRWLKHSAVQDLPQDGMTWRDGLALDSLGALDVYIPALKHTAFYWLTPGSQKLWSTTMCPQIVFSWLERKRGTPEADLVIDKQMKVDQIVEAAKWASLDEGARWHQRLAKTLRDHDHLEEAGEYFEKALALEPEALTAHDARCGKALLFQKQERYQDAIDMDAGSIELLKADVTRDAKDASKEICYCYARMAECYDSLAAAISKQVSPESADQYMNAYRCYKAASHVDQYWYTYAFSGLFQHLAGLVILTAPWGPHKISSEAAKTAGVPYYLDAYEEIMSTVELFWKAEQDDGKSVWLEFMLQPGLTRYPLGPVFDALTLAAAYTGKAAPLLQVYRETILKLQKEREGVAAATQTLALAFLYRLLCKDLEYQDRALALIEPIAIEKAVSLGFHSEVQIVRRLALYTYGDMCLSLAIRQPEHAQRYISKIERVVARSARKNASLDQDTLPASEIVVPLAMWYSDHGREKEARELVRPSIKDCVNMLSDDDPANDIEALGLLSGMLFGIRDDAGAIAIQQMLRPYYNGVTLIRAEGVPVDKVLDLDKNNSILAAKPGGEDEETNAQTAGSESDEFDYINHDRKTEGNCDGPCRVEYNNCDAFWYCRTCSKGFCDTCYKSLKDGELLTSTCEPHHQHYRVPILATPFKKGEIYINGEVMTLEEYKKRLRKEWNL